MTEFRRAWLLGATWFFTLDLTERRGNRLPVERIDVLQTAFRTVRVRHPFNLEAVVILPDHDEGIEVSLQAYARRSSSPRMVNPCSTTRGGWA
jgi:hypothetical protein